MAKRFSDIFISKLGMAVPEKKVSNEDIIESFKLNIRGQTIQRLVGLNTRHWASDDMAASDLASQALDSAFIDEPSGSLWVSTISPDHLTPSTSSILKRKRGWSRPFPTFDLNAACSGFIFAMEQAALRIESGLDEDTVVVATELRSRFLNPQDRRTVFTFGDAAVATQLNRLLESSLFRLMWTDCSTTTCNDFDIWIPGGGSALPLTSENINEGVQYVQISPYSQFDQKLFKIFPEKIENALQSVNQDFHDFDFFVFHQASGHILDKLCDIFRIKKNQTINSFCRFGNTSSSSVGVNLCEALKSGFLKKDHRVLCLSMGAGDHIGIMALGVTH